MPKKIFFLIFCFAVAAKNFSAEAAERTRLVFIGDVMAHIEQLDAAKRGDSWDFSPQFRRVAPLFYDAFAIANFETVLAGEKSGYAGYPMFNTPDELAFDLKNAGIGAVTLATNHILDRREAGAARTAEILTGAEILWTGIVSRDETYEPLVVEYDDLKFAFVNYSYGSNVPASKNESAEIRLNVISDDAIIDGLSKARAVSPDLTVACFHWGIEYQFAPSKSMKSAAALSFENGADIVIGTHPHVLQPMEVISSDKGYKFVAWSLGNFVSNQRTLPRERSAVLAIDIEKNETGAVIKRISVAPTWVSSRRDKGRRLFEVVYAGTGGRFNHAALPPGELKRAREAGEKVLGFLGAAETPDEEGFYTIWDAASPDVLPKGTRKSPM